MNPFKRFTDEVKRLARLTTEDLLIVIAAGRELDGFYRAIITRLCGKEEDETNQRKERR